VGLKKRGREAEGLFLKKVFFLNFSPFWEMGSLKIPPPPPPPNSGDSALECIAKCKLN